MSGEELKYSSNPVVEDRIRGAVSAIESGSEPDAWKVIKIAPTGILLASSEHEQERYQPGNQLVSYTGVTEEGEPVQETWGGGVADIMEDSVILRNEKPIKFPEGHPRAGEEVRGDYDSENKFRVDENGDEKLFNEYVSDVEYVEVAYGIEATEERQVGFKLLPSFAIKLDEDAVIKAEQADINLSRGDYAIIDTKNGQVTSVHGIEKKWFADTYTDFEEYTATLEK